MSNCECNCRPDRPMWKRGDAGYLRCALHIGDEVVTAEDLPLIRQVEFTVNGKSKYYPAEVFFTDGRFMIPVTQEESFAMWPDEPVVVDTRVEFETNGWPLRQIRGTVKDVPELDIAESESEVIL